jgi:hypothetical protein
VSLESGPLIPRSLVDPAAPQRSLHTKHFDPFALMAIVFTVLDVSSSVIVLPPVGVSKA